MDDWDSSSKLRDWESLVWERHRARREGKSVVWTNGCFDLLHVGHVQCLARAKSFGDVLIVGVNSDASVRRLKGSHHPVVPATERAEIVGALGCVDFVVVFDEDTPETALRRLQPDVHCKGSDYGPASGKAIPEAAIVEAYGGRVEFIPLVPGKSTSALIRRIHEQRPA